jgi:hypothetical protein
MSAVVWIVVAIVVVAGIFLAARWAVGQGRRHALRTRFGPEYDRALREHGDDRAAAEAELAEVARERSAAAVRPLTPAERATFTERWTAIQADFVEKPVEATHDAGELVTAVLRTRGYPAGDSAAQVRAIVADHPDVAESYRAARAATSTADTGGSADDSVEPLAPERTERLRASLIGYRNVFDRLVGTTNHASARTASATDSDASPYPAEPAENASARGDTAHGDTAHGDTARGDTAAAGR